jgi:hypothetical protein
LLTVIDEIILIPNVNSEITRDHQRSILDRFMMDSQCRLLDDDALSTQAIFLANSSGLGKGECFAYHHAVFNDCYLATDDRRAMRIFSTIGEKVTIITSVDILKVLVTQGVIDEYEAKDIVAQWSSLYRFRVDWPS